MTRKLANYKNPPMLQLEMHLDKKKTSHSKLFKCLVSLLLTTPRTPLWHVERCKAWQACLVMNAKLQLNNQIVEQMVSLRSFAFQSPSFIEKSSSIEKDKTNIHTIADLTHVIS